MKQQPDKLFQEKLADYGRPAPAMAWDKIEKQLDKKNNKLIWYRVAAAVLVLAISIPIFYSMMKESSTPEGIAKRKNNVPANQKETEPITVPVEGPEVSTSVAKSENKIQPQTKVPYKVIADETISVESVAVIENVEPLNTGDREPVVMEENREEEVIAYHGEVTPETESIVANSDQGLTLVISAKETTSYFEGAENFSAGATHQEKKTSTFRKLLRKASDLKTNQDPFGELRQKKNEILALNFKSDKKRSQKN